MSDLDTKDKKSHNLEELVAMGMYKAKKDKIMKMLQKIEEYGGEKKSIEEIRTTSSKIDSSMSDYIISERE